MTRESHGTGKERDTLHAALSSDAAGFYRVVRNIWLARLSEATTDEERVDASSSAMDSLYSFFLAHTSMEADRGE